LRQELTPKAESILFDKFVNELRRSVH